MKEVRFLIISIFTIFLVSNSTTFSQEGKSEVDPASNTEIKLGYDYNQNELLTFIKEDNKLLFNSKDEYIRFITKSAQVFKGSNTLVYAEICFRIAEILSNENSPYDAYDYLDQVSTIIKSKDISKISFAAEFYNMKGTYFYNFRRYEESRVLLLKAFKHVVDDSFLKISVLNTLGLTHKRLNDIDSSIYYFSAGLELATKIDNNEWIGIINGNLGYIYYLNGDLISARKCLILDKELSLKNEQTESALNAVGILIEMDLEDENYDMVETNMKILDSLIEKVSDLTAVTRYHYTKTLYWEHIQNYKKAYETYRQSVVYKDSADREYDQSNLQDMIFQIKFQKKRNENELLIEKEKRTGQLFYGVAAILSVITLALGFIIYLMKKRKRDEHKILELEKEKIQTELKRNETELTKILKNLVEKNEIIDTLNQEIHKREKIEDNLNIQKEKEGLHEKINSFTLLTETDLVEFKQLFDKIHPGFYNLLTNQYIDLTQAETRLAMLIRLNLSNLEMSRILGISQDSVRKSNLRLRKKLSIESQNELIQFIKSI